MNKIIKRDQGYVALSSVLVISAVILVIGISTSLLSISEAQMSLAEEKNTENLALIETCVEEALLRINEDHDLPSQITVPEGICDIAIEDQTVDNWTTTWTFTVTDTDQIKKVRVTAVEDIQVSVNSWQEISP